MSPPDAASSPPDAHPEALAVVDSGPLAPHPDPDQSSRPNAVLTPFNARRRPFPKVAPVVLVLASVAGSLADANESVEVASFIVAGLACARVFAWLEQRIYQRLLSRGRLGRLFLSALVPWLGLVLAIPLMVAAGLLTLVPGISVLPPAVLVGALWFGSAASGSFVVVLIDTVVSALVFNFRARVQLAVLLLASSAAVVSVGLVMGAKALADFAVQQIQAELASGRVEDTSAAFIQTLVRSPEQATNWLWLAVIGGVAVLILPAIVSACGKLADAVMERLNPLDEAFERVIDGDLEVEIEVGGSRELQRIAGGFNRMAGSLRETLTSLDQRNQQLLATNQASSRFVPFAFLDLLHKQSIVEIARGDQVQLDITVLFADIRGFTTLAEAMGPEETFAFINRYLAHVEPTIVAEGGVINQIMGDGIMALFPNGADAGVRAAIGMTEALARFNAELEAEGREPIRIGIGIESGDLMLGTIGGRERLSCTVIGDPANAAARVEGMTKLYRAQILLGEGTWRRLQHRYDLREVDRVQAVGKQEPMRIFEVLQGLPPDEYAQKSAARDDFERAIESYRRGDFTEAEEAFEALSERCPGDGTVQLYRKRVPTLRPMEGNPDWDGISRLETK